jgi:hypothetical protein
MGKKATSAAEPSSGQGKLSNIEYCSTLYKAAKKDAILYKCEPVDWMWMPKPLRTAIAMITLTLFACTFLVVPLLSIFLIPAVWRIAPLFSSCFVGSAVLSLLLPAREWEWGRRLGQLWYEVLDLHCNTPPEYRRLVTKERDSLKLIMAMHPHGIVPFHAVLWAAFCDQYYQIDGKKLYGFGAAADVVQYLPFLRNIMGWLSAGGADYKVLLEGLELGRCPPVSAVGRECTKNLFILPGGIAEVFTSTPRKHAIVFKKRKGLIRLSLETGAMLCPTYVFGATDFFENLATNESSIFAQFSRKFRMGVTIFWGLWGTPVPYCPKISLCIAEPIPVERWDKSKGPIPAELIDKLHQQYLDAIVDVFETYKAAAGYPDAELIIQ